MKCFFILWYVPLNHTSSVLRETGFRINLLEAINPKIQGARDVFLHFNPKNLGYCHDTIF